MNQRPFGRLGVSVSEITYGGMHLDLEQLRGGVSPSLLHALECGVTSIDTARGYGGSEAIIGRTLKEWRGARPFVATKIRPLSDKSWREFVPMEETFTAQSIRESVETSLQELAVERLDFVELHQWYYLWTHQPGWLETFRDLKREGKIAGFGISTQDHEHDAVLQVVDAGLIDGLQLVFNVFESRPLTSLLPLARMRDVGVIARNVLDHGGLTRVLTPEEIAANGMLRKPAAAHYAERIAPLAKIAADTDQTLLQLAIRFALTHPAVSTLTLSIGTREYVDAAVEAAALGPLDSEIFNRIEKDHVWTKNLWE